MIGQMSAYLGDHNIPIKFFQKRFVRTKLDVYACIAITWSIPKLVDITISIVYALALTWIIRHIYVSNLQFQK
jgi:hypothetical protein